MKKNDKILLMNGNKNFYPFEDVYSILDNDIYDITIIYNREEII